MAKIISETERRLQKKLIPVNLFVCIICLVAAVSLFITPFLKIDAGKILRDEGTVAFVEEKVDGMVGGTLEDAGHNTVDYAPVVGALVANVLGSAKGELSFSAFDAFKIIIAKSDNKAELVLNMLFFGEKGIVNDLIDSVADGVVNLFETSDGKALVEQMVVSIVSKSFASELSEEAEANLEKNLPALTDKFKELGAVKNREEAVEAIGGFVTALDEAFGDAYDMSDSRDAVADYILNIYDKTVDELANKQGEEFSAEALISVAVSQNVDLGKFNLEELLGGLIKSSDEGSEDNGEDNGEQSEQTPARYVVAVDEAVDGEQSGEDGYESAGDGSESVEGGTDDTQTGTDNPASGEDRVICTNYNEILAAMGLDSEKIDELKDAIKTALRSAVDKGVEPYEQYISKYGYAFYGMLVFIGPWVILFLFSFFHMIAKNKMFSMWYVKLYSFLPCLVFFVAPKLAPVILSHFFPKILEGSAGPLIKAALSGISSFTWISGICYVVLWLVSIFWAFPIKHKIRKERRAVKRALKSGNYPPAESNGYQSAAASGSYGDGYGGYGSAQSSYGNGYGSNYGGYGSDYDYGGFDDTYDGDLSDLSSYGYGDGLDTFDSLYDDYDPYKSPFDDDDDY